MSKKLAHGIRDPHTYKNMYGCRKIRNRRFRHKERCPVEEKMRHVYQIVMSRGLKTGKHHNTFVPYTH